eukprot:TRINITY_DN64503_c2_g1_i1.p4 TRINITY_DN64503_c2_g1~~TRINITY_DN64503_c2_g1_i1.p4  ORF type:complete len:350 (+),score=33.59 TRINITY_DN64503_c2_g1_i1:2958-4007(+)
MSKEKVKLLELPGELVKAALMFLAPKELLYPLMQVNRRFKELASDPMVMTVSFFSSLKVPLTYGGREFAALRAEERGLIIKDVLWASGINERLPMMAYYTDGGVDGKDSKFFISNIYADNPSCLYCSVRGENVHVKATFSEIIPSHIELSDISKYAVPESKTALYSYPEHTYSYPIKSLISKHEPQHHKQFAVVKYHDLNRNLTNYTCFLQSFAVFISMEEIDPNHPLVRLFDGVKKLEQVEALGFEHMSLQSSEDTKVVEFSLQSLKNIEEVLQKNVPGAKLNGVYPLIWGDISKNTTNYLNVIQRVGFRFMLLKLIDSHKSQADGNIDCYTISLSGNLIKLRHTHEE